MQSFNALNRASSFFIPPAINRSTSALKTVSWSATIKFKMVIACAQVAEEPTARNSNLLPVNAKGEVRFLSVLSSSISGILPTTLSLSSVFFSGDILPPSSFSSSSNTEVSWLPMKAEMIAGGASLAPKRWSLPAEAIAARSKSEWSWTALMVLMKKVRNCKFFLGVEPGESKLTPVLVLSDQLLCLPDPLIPAKGFSCNSTRKSWRRATLSMISMNKEFWSTEMLASP